MFKRNCLENGPFMECDDSKFIKDKEILNLIRQNIFNELSNINIENVNSILEIGPSDDINKRFNKIKNINDNVIYHTLDIIDNGSTYIHDITKPFDIDIKYDLILLSEVLEHTSNPFNVIKNLEKILNTNGKIFISFPFNFRIHGPLPDCWRISEFGFKNIINETNLKIISLEALILLERPYFPIHYTSFVVKN